MHVDRYTKIFADRLAKKMNEKGISLTELSRKSDIAHPVILRYLAGKSFPNVWRIANLAHALECTTDELCGVGEIVVDW